jgi:sarcosine oxidase subunit gamma
MAEPLRFLPPPQGGLERHSALADLSDLLPDLAPGVRLDEMPFPGQLLLCGKGEAFFAAVQDVLGCPPPLMPNHVGEGERSEILWLAPESWLVLLSGGQEEVISRRLKQAFVAGGVGSAAVIDQSDSRVVFHLYGPNARNLLEKGCALDLHPSAMPPGRCARTLIAGMSILLQTLQGDSRVGPVVYRVLVANSTASSFVKWLVCGCEAY